MNKLSTFAAVSVAIVAFTTQALALNPQPEPPGKSRVLQVSAMATLSRTAPAGTVMLNPQPLPPKESELRIRSNADGVMLNPQPLPPKDGGPVQH